MLKHHKHRNLTRVIGMLLISISTFASVAYGVTSNPETQKASLRSALFDDLNEIQKEVDNAEYADALSQLDQLETKFQNPPLNGLESAQIANLSGYVYFLQKDYNNSISAYKRIAQLDHGAPQLQTATLGTIAQLYYTLGKYDQSLPYIDSAIAAVESSDQVPQENWLVLQRNANLEIGNALGAAESLNKLNKFYPDSKHYDAETKSKDAKSL